MKLFNGSSFCLFGILFFFCNVKALSQRTDSFRVAMPEVIPVRDDSYLCTAFSLESLVPSTKLGPIFLNKFEAESDANKAHHIILQSCRVLSHQANYEGPWDCQQLELCQEGEEILFAWARRAPATLLPEGVAFKIDPSKTPFLVLQVHYAHKLREGDSSAINIHYQTIPPLYIAGIFLMMRTELEIPGRKSATHGDMNCMVRSEIHPFAFRVHAHKWGTVISGYKYDTSANEMTEIARGNPQWPQAFFPVTKNLTLKPGDFLVARCTYNTTDNPLTTYIGSGSEDEMCNMYIMYYGKEAHFQQCFDEQSPLISTKLPQDSDSPLSSNSELETMARGGVEVELDHKLNTSGNERKEMLKAETAYLDNNIIPSKAKKQYGKVYGQFNPGPIYQQPQQIPPVQYPNLYPVGGYQNQIPYSNYYVPVGNDVDASNQQYDPSFAYSNGLAYYPSQATEQEPIASTTTSAQVTDSPTNTNNSSNSEKKQDSGPKKTSNNAGLYTVPSWPPTETVKLIGQPSGIAIDTFGNPVIFHRGDRVWDGSTFKSNNVYAGDTKTPIPTNTILTLDKDTGKVLNAWGAGLFFLPHMITIDSQNKVWVTDVALHQVFHFQPYGGTGEKKQPDIVLGTPFQPGNDDHHYCKPTSVAVMKDARTFFVADGYCNSRIIQYIYDVMPDGHHNVTKIISWGIANGAGVSYSKSPYSFNVPHGLALAENKNLVCVADRENGRVQCFNTEGGKFQKSLKPQEFGSTIYGNLYAIGGPENFGNLYGKTTQGYIINLETGKLINTFNGGDEGFKMPHDIAVTQDGSFVYVVEINPFRIWKLSTGKISQDVNPVTTSNNILQSGLSPADYIKKIDLKALENIVPSTTLGVGIVIASVLLTCVISVCISCRKCRKRGKGKGAKQSKKYKKDNGKLDLGDLLGRSKDGFKPLKTDEDDAVILSSDSDVEDFSVPALHA